MDEAWEEELAQKSNRVHGGAALDTEKLAREDGKSRDYPKIDRKPLVGPFFDKLESAFDASIKKFNQKATEKIKASGAKKGKGGKEFDIEFMNRAFSFEETGKGYIRIWRKRRGGDEEFAFVGPHPADTHFKGFVEKEALGYETNLTPVTEGDIVRKYITLLVEKP